MASDQRDWYRDWWRKKTGYTERAHFRISFGEHQRNQYRGAWRRNWIAVGMVAGVIATVAIAKRFLT